MPETIEFHHSPMEYLVNGQYYYDVFRPSDEMKLIAAYETATDRKVIITIKGKRDSIKYTATLKRNCIQPCSLECFNFIGPSVISNE